MKPTVAIDLDGVLAQYDGWNGVDHFGDPIPGAVDFTLRLTPRFNIIIHTCRCSYGMNGREASSMLVGRVRNWLDRHGFAYDHIWSEPGKPIANFYVDDRAVTCRPQEDPGAFRKVEKRIRQWQKR